MSSFVWPPQPSGSGGGGVTSLNSLTGDLNLVAGSGISVTPSGTELIIAATGSGMGSVTSVAMTTPGVLFTVTGSPITTFGTLALNLVTQTANLVFAGPTSGAAATPTFRSLGLTDLPSIANNTIMGNNTGSSAAPVALTVAQVNAILPVFTSSLNGIVPNSSGGTANFLRADGTWAVPAGGGSGSGFAYLSSNTSVYGGTNSTLSFTGNYNTVIGPGAGANLTSGSRNTLLGSGAGADISTGTFNVVIGDTTAATGSNSTVIGSEAESQASYGICIGFDASNRGTGSIVIANEHQSTYNNTINISPGSGGANGADGSANSMNIGSWAAGGSITSVNIGRGSAGYVISTGESLLTQVSIVASAVPPSITALSNSTGANLLIVAGNGVGTGGSGNIQFQTAPAGSTGDAANTLVTVGSISNTGAHTLGAASTTPTHALNTATVAPASGVGTITNLPAGKSGNPTGYLSITINGVAAVIPYW